MLIMQDITLGKKMRTLRIVAIAFALVWSIAGCAQQEEGVPSGGSSGFDGGD